MERLNDVGPQIRRLRYERGWTQDLFAAKLQLHGWDISREGVAKVEGGYHLVSDRQLVCLSRVFNLNVSAFFPMESVATRGGAVLETPSAFPAARRQHASLL